MFRTSLKDDIRDLPSFDSEKQAEQVFELLFEEHNRMAEAIMNGA